MPLNKNYSIHAAVWNATVLPGVTGVGKQLGRDTRVAGHAGSVFPRYAAAAIYAQYVSLQTVCLKSLWSKLNASTLVPCASLASNGPLALYAALGDDVLPSFASGTSHEKLNIAKGLVMMKSLAWSQPGQGAVMECGVYPLSADGQANAWDPGVAGVALPTLPAAEEDYDLHSATITAGALTLDGMTDFRLSIETGARQRHNPGDIYPTYMSQAPVNSLIRVSADFTLPDSSLVRSWGPHFKGAALDTMNLSFRQFKQAAARDTVGQVDIQLIGAVQVTEGKDARQGTVSVHMDGISTNGTTTPFSWVLN